MRWANLGHPPPLLRRADGTTGSLTGSDLMFRYPHYRTGAPLDRDVVLGPGDLLLLYTDGLIERRNSDIDAGIDRLRSLLATATSDDLDQLIDTLIRQLAGDTVPDDVVVLAVAVRP